MTVTVYVEGGGNNKDTSTRCRQGFSEYCKNVAPLHPRPRIVACGGRQQAFDRFNTEVVRNKEGDLCILLVDSEGPVEATMNSIAHLQAHDGCRLPVSETLKIFLMVQAMEAWFLADRNALATYYGAGFRRENLPGDERRIEEISKNDLEPSLVSATRDTQKGRYHKTRHGFALLGLIDPLKVQTGSPYAQAFHSFLRSLPEKALN